MATQAKPKLTPEEYLAIERSAEYRSELLNGEMFAHYRRIESVIEYILISQDKVLIEHYMRQPDGTWLLETAERMEDRIELRSVSCTFALADVYEKVEL